MGQIGDGVGQTEGGQGIWGLGGVDGGWVRQVVELIHNTTQHNISMRNNFSHLQTAYCPVIRNILTSLH